MTDTAAGSVKLERTNVRSIARAPLVEAPFATTVVELARERPDIVVLSADLSKYTDIHPFAETFPERFFQLGMAEQNMMGVAGGLAKTGFCPIAVTYTVFATRRAGDQVQMALATGHRTAVIAAFLPGITTPFRASHQGTDDLAIMRAIPGMTVIDPMDATELSAALRAAVSVPGPVYLRGLRASVAEVLVPPYEFEIGRARLLREGSDVGLVGTGLGTQWALEAAELLETRGTSAAVLHVPTIKPFDTTAVVEFASHFRALVSVENHSVVGGLGSAVCEAVAGAGMACRVRRCGVPDRWADAGPLDFIRERLGLDGPSLATSVVDNQEAAR
jgi:transketolase